jgi:hypothetical protein
LSVSLAVTECGSGYEQKKMKVKIEKPQERRRNKRRSKRRRIRARKGRKKTASVV